MHRKPHSICKKRLLIIISNCHNPWLYNRRPFIINPINDLHLWKLRKQIHNIIPVNNKILPVPSRQRSLRLNRRRQGHGRLLHYSHRGVVRSPVLRSQLKKQSLQLNSQSVRLMKLLLSNLKHLAIHWKLLQNIKQLLFNTNYCLDHMMYLLVFPGQPVCRPVERVNVSFSWEICNPVVHFFLCKFNFAVVLFPKPIEIHTLLDVPIVIDVTHWSWWWCLS